MSTSYLDKSGLSYFWGKIKAYVTNAASSTTPKMDGTATVGTETTFARGDHIHPSDTTRVPTTRTVNGHALSSNVTLGGSDIDITYQGDTWDLETAFNDLAENASKTTWYGTSSTTASTAAKVVTCSNFVLTAGSIIGILFTTANTAATPTLNVNSTGAKSIYIGNSTPSSTTNVLKWSANTMLYFLYDGTYFRYITSVSAASVAQSRGAGTWSGTCTTAASTAAKTSAITNYVLTTGSLVSIAFTYAVPASATLNINSTGAKNIRYHGANITADLISAGDVATFMYDGSYYRLLTVDRSAASSYSNTGVDYIVEQNVGDETGGYTKWNSGKLEIWKRVTVNVNVTSGMSGGFYYGTISAISYPVEFSHYPAVNITAQVQYGYGWLVPSYDNYSTSNTGTLYIYYVASKSNVAVTLNVSAVGRWK